MFGPEGRPQHCCAWLGVASSFPECASPVVPEEVIHEIYALLPSRPFASQKLEKGIYILHVSLKFLKLDR